MKGLGVKFTLVGDERIDQIFVALQIKMRKKILREALRPAAKIILAQAKANVPVVTGRGRQSLRVMAQKRSRKNPNQVGVNVATSAGWFKGKEYYLGFGELGFKLGSRKVYDTPAGPRHKLGNRYIRQRIPIEGKHWIRKALEQKRAEARDLAIKLIVAGVEREAKADA